MFDSILQDGLSYQTMTKADRAASKADLYGEEVTALRLSVQRLTLASQAMWELVRELPGFSEGKLKAKIQEIDLRDGTADGRITQQPLDCPVCGAKTNSKRTNCLMCGAAIEKPNVFEA